MSARRAGLFAGRCWCCRRSLSRQLVVLVRDRLVHVGCEGAALQGVRS